LYTKKVKTENIEFNTLKFEIQQKKYYNVTTWALHSNQPEPITHLTNAVLNTQMIFFKKTELTETQINYPVQPKP